MTRLRKPFLILSQMRFQDETTLSQKAQFLQPKTNYVKHGTNVQLKCLCKRHHLYSVRSHMHLVFAETECYFDHYLS